VPGGEGKKLIAVARALYRRGDGEAAQGLAALGLPGELAGHFGAQPVWVYPENWRAVRVFDALGTQWRVGPAGPTGLDYAALPMVMDVHGVPQQHRHDVFEDVRVLESAALEELLKR
jgi:hypothetical protein